MIYECCLYHPPPWVQPRIKYIMSVIISKGMLQKRQSRRVNMTKSLLLCEVTRRYGILEQWSTGHRAQLTTSPKTIITTHTATSVFSPILSATLPTRLSRILSYLSISKKVFKRKTPPAQTTRKNILFTLKTTRKMRCA